MKRLFMFMLAAVMFAACSEDVNIDINNPTPEEEANLESYAIEVGFEAENETRIALNESLETVWQKGDLVSVFYKGTTMTQWKFQGETGDKSGTIVPVAMPGSSTINSNIVVLYPYGTDYTYSGGTGVTATIGNEQTYAPNSYGTNGNILVARSQTSEMKLRNVYGWIKLLITDDAASSVKSIRLRGNRNEQLSGRIQFGTDGENASFVNGGTPATEVVLNCGEGVALSSEPTAFLIGLVPQAFEEGIAIEIESTEGKTMTKATTNSITIERNCIQPMISFEFEPAVEPEPEPDPEEVELMFPSNNQIWYNTSNGTAHNFTIAQPFDISYTANGFGNACANGTCYSLYGILFDGDVKVVNQAAFHNSYLTTVYLPHSVTTVGQSAFLASSKLKEVHLGNGIKEIQMGAFTNCINLQTLYIRATTPPTLGDYALLQDTSGTYKYIGCTIYVPQSAVDTYKNDANWSKYKDYIRAYDFIAGKEPGNGSGDVGGDDSSRTNFNHRLLIIDHTGVNCGYCPKASDALHALAKSDMKNYYNEVQVHGGGFAPNGVDPAYSEAASVVDKFYAPTGYPYVVGNFHGNQITFGSSEDFVGSIMPAFFNSSRKKFGADAGIAINSKVEGSTIRVNLSVKSAKAQEYNVAVWVLENDIYSPNQNSNYGTPTEEQKTYNHALRYSVTSYSKYDISGDWIGEIAEGEEKTASYTIPLNSAWATNNLEILVIASAPNANGDYEVVNTAVCPVNGTKGYEYISDLENGGGSGDGDDSGDGSDSGDNGGGEADDDSDAIILSDFIKGSHNSSYGFVQYTAGNDDGSQIKLYINEGAHELTVVNYAYVVGDLQNCSLVFTSQQSNAGNNGTFHANGIKVAKVSKTATGGTLVYLNNKLTINLTFDDGTSQKFVYNGN
ncbi:MAG: Omp28-related outer membrane protein [Alistipes sp.]|nr:Omp28-related outer membrane protein [Alistipes sp.]